MAAGIDFWAPFENDRLLEVRTSKMKLMPGLRVTSGIDKELRGGEMVVNKLGLEGDEHDPTFHGGVDKAILGCKSFTFKVREEEENENQMVTQGEGNHASLTVPLLNDEK